MEAGGGKIPALAALKKSNEDDFKDKTHKIRSDGAWVDAGENDNAIVQTLEKTPAAVGVFGYSFLREQHGQGQGREGRRRRPDVRHHLVGAYPLSRSLYIYVKKANIGVTPGLKEFLDGFTSDAATGKGGYLQQRGLIPLPQADHEAQKAALKALTPMAAPTS